MADSAYNHRLGMRPSFFVAPVESRDMNSPDDRPVRCRVCGRTLDSDDELESHLRDQGLLW